MTPASLLSFPADLSSNPYELQGFTKPQDQDGQLVFRLYFLWLRLAFRGFSIFLVRSTTREALEIWILRLLRPAESQILVGIRRSGKDRENKES